MAPPHRMSTVVLLTLAVVAMLMEVGGNRQPRQGRRTKRGNDMCSSNSVAEYKLTFYGAWSKEKFPKMYPRSRPHAQWSKLVGRTHDKSHQMWSEGNTSSLALKKFAEEEDSELLEMQVQGYDGVYDTFSCEPLARGEGKTSTVILADGTHSKVSFVVRIIPSPDWFVGVDGLDLCQNGRWRQKVSVNLRPLDAGTDQGITFTAPNWPSHPLQAVQKITAFFPSHPASPFYYPEYKKLPRIAHAEMQLVAQYLRRGAASSHKPNGESNVIIYGDDTVTSAPSTAASSSDRALAEMAEADNRSASGNPSAGGYADSKKTEQHPTLAATGALDSSSRVTDNPALPSQTESQVWTEERGHFLQRQGALLDGNSDSETSKEHREDQTGHGEDHFREPLSSIQTDLSHTSQKDKETRLSVIPIEDEKEFLPREDENLGEPSTELNFHHKLYTPNVYKAVDMSTPQMLQAAGSSPNLMTLAPKPEGVGRNSPHAQDSQPFRRAEETRKETSPNSTDSLMRVGVKEQDDHTDLREVKGPAEPGGSQSRDTFRQPQFAEISADDPYRTYESELTAEPVDCRVTEWGEWGPCSKTCGFGLRLRSRAVLSHARNGGSVCPVLQYEALCGGMSTCNWKHFDFLSQKTSGTTRRRRLYADHRAQQG